MGFYAPWPIYYITLELQEYSVIRAIYSGEDWNCYRRIPDCFVEQWNADPILYSICIFQRLGCPGTANWASFLGAVF